MLLKTAFSTRLKTITQLSALPLLLASSPLPAAEPLQEVLSVTSPVSAAEPTKQQICQEWAKLHANHTDPKMNLDESELPLYIESMDSCNYFLDKVRQEGELPLRYECTVPYSAVSSYMKQFNDLSATVKVDSMDALKKFAKEKITTPLCPKR